MNSTQDTIASHATTSKASDSDDDDDDDDGSGSGESGSDDDEDTRNHAQTTATEFEPYSGGKSSPDDVSDNFLLIFSFLKLHFLKSIFFIIIFILYFFFCI